MENLLHSKTDSRTVPARAKDNQRRTYPYLAYKEAAPSKLHTLPLRREFAHKPRHAAGANGLVGGLIGGAIALFLSLNAAAVQPLATAPSISSVLSIASGALVGGVLGVALGAMFGKIFGRSISGQPELPVEQSDILVTLRPTAHKRRTYFEQDATRSNLG